MVCNRVFPLCQIRISSSLRTSRVSSVQRTERFVEQQHVGITYQRACKRRTLLHSTR